MIRMTTATLLVGLLFQATALAQSRPVPYDFREPEMTPAQKARHYLDQGMTAKAKAEKLEGKLAVTEGAAREKLQKKILKAWKKAAHEFGLAAETYTDLYQAHGELGLALFKTGDVDGGLASLDHVIEEAAGYNTAIGYRAQIYLSLDRIDEAKEAYETLDEREDEAAVVLLASMRQWVESQRSGAESVDVAVVDELERWIAER